MQKSNEKGKSEGENTESRLQKSDDKKAPLAGFADMLAAAEMATHTSSRPEIQVEPPTAKAPDALKGAEVRSAGDAASLSTGEFEKQRQRFWKENGVELTKTGDGRYEFRMHGYKETLCTSDATPQGLEEAHKRIEQIRQAKIAELGKVYGAKFSVDGETAGKQAVYDKKKNDWFYGAEDVTCRAPKLHELLGIEAALKVSQPSAHGVKFYLMTKQLYKNFTEMADYSSVPHGGSDKRAKPGEPAIFLNANLTMNYPSTEAAAKNWMNSDRRGTSLEDTISHELVHHSQKVMNWETSVKGGARTFGMEMSSLMGWVTGNPPERRTNLWFLTDKDGNTWKHEHMGGNEWVRMKVNGQPLDEHGNPCPYAKVQRITNGDMVEIARVRPATTYNDTPREEFAEGMTRFRDGHRAELWQNNRVLYGILKDADQREINKAHPPGKDKKPSHIRAADGTIVANTAAAQAEIKKLEI